MLQIWALAAYAYTVQQIRIYHGLSNCLTRLGMSTPITSSICGVGGAGVAGSRYFHQPWVWAQGWQGHGTSSHQNCCRLKGTYPPPPPLSAPPSPSSSLTHLLDHRGRELRELQQIKMGACPSPPPLSAPPPPPPPPPLSLTCLIIADVSLGNCSRSKWAPAPPPLLCRPPHPPLPLLLSHSPA